MSQYMNNVEFLNCHIESNILIPIGVWNKADVVYSNGITPILRMYNTVFVNSSGVEPSTSMMFMNIKNDNYDAKCYISNITLYNVTSSSGYLFKSDAEEDYNKHNIIDLYTL